jgi:DNA primase
VSLQWKNEATAFVNRSHDKLLSSEEAIDHLKLRGFTAETMRTFHLGWNESDLYDVRTTWGLKPELNQNGRERKQWLPNGIIIPFFEDGYVVRIKIRRTDWHPNDHLPKYVEASGGLQRPSLYGDKNKPIIVIESELDAILIQQFASDLCCCIALGGVGKKPDQQTHELLRSSPLVLLALDYDEAGKKEYLFWMSLYPSLRPWPARKGKSPGDSYNLHQVDLRKWVIDGLS